MLRKPRAKRVSRREESKSDVRELRHIYWTEEVTSDSQNNSSTSKADARL